jgi:hypothetical protein
LKSTTGGWECHPLGSPIFVVENGHLNLNKTLILLITLKYNWKSERNLSQLSKYLYHFGINYFSFCQTFEKIFIICANILIKSKSSNSQSFQPWTSHDNDLKIDIV